MSPAPVWASAAAQTTGLAESLHFWQGIEHPLKRFDWTIFLRILPTATGFSPHLQKGLECNICHGESVKHRTSQGHTEPDRVAAPHEIPALCGGCHLGKGPKAMQTGYAGSKHGKLVLDQFKVRAPHCGNCHGAHSIRAWKTLEVQCKKCHTALSTSCSAPPPKASTAVSCTACHSPHTLLLRASR